MKKAMTKKDLLRIGIDPRSIYENKDGSVGIIATLENHYDQSNDDQRNRPGDKYSRLQEQ